MRRNQIPVLLLDIAVVIGIFVFAAALIVIILSQHGAGTAAAR